jgi:hypothetical protein
MVDLPATGRSRDAAAQHQAALLQPCNGARDIGPIDAFYDVSMGAP